MGEGFRSHLPLLGRGGWPTQEKYRDSILYGADGVVLTRNHFLVSTPRLRYTSHPPQLRRGSQLRNRLWLSWRLLPRLILIRNIPSLGGQSYAEVYAVNSRRSHSDARARATLTVSNP
jgi:hypothetical protein